MAKETKSKGKPTQAVEQQNIDEMKVFVSEMMHYIQRISEVLDRIEKRLNGGF